MTKANCSTLRAAKPRERAAKSRERAAKSRWRAAKSRFQQIHIQGHQAHESGAALLPRLEAQQACRATRETARRPKTACHIAFASRLRIGGASGLPGRTRLSWPVWSQIPWSLPMAGAFLRLCWPRLGPVLVRASGCVGERRPMAGDREPKHMAGGGPGGGGGRVSWQEASN